MVVIFEGLDGAGKSTIVEYLKSLPFFRFEFIKESYAGPGADVRKQSLKALQERIKSKTVFVYDRCACIDDFVYEPVMHKQQSPFHSLDLISEVRQALSKCLIIHLDVTPERAAARLAERGDDYITVEQLPEIAAAYECAYKQLAVSPFKISTMTNDLVTTHLRCANLIQQWLGTYTAKTFKLAHIVPLQYLHLTKDNMYHMCLAHLIKENKAYADFYKERRAQGQFVLMDNGAAEGSQLSLEDLLMCYKRINPSELVLPDELCNAERTYEKTKQALAYFEEQGVKCQFMAVPQGRTFEEWCTSAEQLIDLPVHSLGVSKFLTIATKDRDIREEAVQFIDMLRRKHNRYVEVHLLGCDAGAYEPAAVRTRFSFVRGCDTALAEIFTKAGERLSTFASRPSAEINFLEEPLTVEHQQLLSLNIETFNQVCKITNIKSNESNWISD